MRWFCGPGFGPGGFLWIIRPIMFLVWMAIAVGVVYLIRPHLKYRTSLEKTPLDIAKERYARGEITAEEFEIMKSKL